jgi:hypothetical protein
MALFNDPPELTVAEPENPKASYPIIGVQGSRQIYQYGGNTYMAMQQQRDPDLVPNASPFVAIRGEGGPWTALDAISEENRGDIWAFFFTFLSSCQIGSVLHFALSTSSPFDLYYLTFDLAGGEWGTLVRPYADLENTVIGTPFIGPLSDGRVIIAWANAGGNADTDESKFAFASAGSVGAANTLVAFSENGTAITINGLVIDANDTAHVLYTRVVGPVADLYHVTVSSDTAGTPYLVEATYPPPAYEYVFGPGVLFNGKVTFTGSRQGVSDQNVYLFEYDGVSWTKKTVATRTNDVSSGHFPYVCPVAISGQLYIFWAENDTSFYPASTGRVYYSIYTGSSFSAKAIAWDAGNNPYPGASGPPAGDHNVLFPSLIFDEKLRMLAWSDYTADFLQAELYLEVSIGIGLHALITAIPIEGPKPLAVLFDGSASTGPITSYSWDFGDGSEEDVTSGSTVDHVYIKPGVYTACLTVSDGVATDTSCVEITVTHRRSRVQ